MSIGGLVLAALLLIADLVLTTNGKTYAELGTTQTELRAQNTQAQTASSSTLAGLQKQMRVSMVVHDPAEHAGFGQCQRCLPHTSPTAARPRSITWHRPFRSGSQPLAR